MNEKNEILDEFVSEIKQIHQELEVIVATQLKTSKMQNCLFEKFGQLVDRIYGTAMTLGFTDIGKYFLAMKDISYMSSQSEFVVSQRKALRMMIECVDYIQKIVTAIYNQEALKNLARLLTVEIIKAERLAKTDFHHITRRSIA